MDTSTHFVSSKYVCRCVCVSKLEGTELLINGQDVGVELCGEQQVLQGSHVLLDGHMVHEEDLLQPLDAVFVPGRADVHAACLTANQMLRQQHDETLEDDE